MKFELLIFGITAFFIINTYYDGKYVQILKSWKKYYQMIGIGFIGLSLYLFIKKYPQYTRNLFTHANTFIKYMPIDKDSSDMISPFLTAGNIYSNLNTQNYNTSQQKRMMNSGGNSNKRSVGETKKKYVASQQNWKCAHCQNQLEAWYDVDHKVRLEYGGSNHITNLEALCKNCHGKKTAMENML
jgi:hypothetical protein